VSKDFESAVTYNFTRLSIKKKYLLYYFYTSFWERLRKGVGGGEELVRGGELTIRIYSIFCWSEEKAVIYI